jgi:hypothetical protein
MDPNALHTDTQAVYASRATLPDGSVVTKTGCTIYIPTWFEEKGLATIGSDIFIAGLYLITLPDKACAVSLINAMMQITPSKFSVVKIEGESYYEFAFDKGARIIKTTQLVKDNKFVYKIYNGIFSQGKVPFYLSYHSLAKVFDSALKYSGANIGSNQEVTELVVSIIARSAKDMSKYYREVVQSLGELKTNPPVLIALRNVAYAPSNTLDKLAGSYMETGVISALNRPATRTERIEEILRA